MRRSIAISTMLAICFLNGHAISPSDDTIVAFSYVNGVKLSSYCHSSVGSQCADYIAGVLDAHDIVDAMAISAHQQPSLCMKHNVPLNEIVNVVTVYMDKNPSMLRYPAPFAVITALHEIYPCEEG